MKKLRTEWTAAELLKAVHKKDLRSEDDFTFRIVGKIIGDHEGYESALFVRIGHDWMLVDGSELICASCERLNEIARDIITFIEKNKMAFERYNVVELFDEDIPATQAG